MVDATVTLYKDVGLGMDYSRTMDFSSKATQKQWFASRPANQKLVLTDVNYNKVQNSFYVHEEVGDVYGYSYVSIENLDNSERVYYGFIANVTLVDDETTRFDIVIDPLQTFLGEYEIRESFIVRQHMDRWQISGSPTPTVLFPSAEKTNSFMRDGDFYGLSSNTIKPIVVALSANDKRTGGDIDNPVDKIYYAVALVDVANPDKQVKGVRAVRDAHINQQSAEVESNDTYVDYVLYPSLNDFITGNFLDLFTINPESIVSISILPIANIQQVTSSVNVKFPGATVYFDRIITGEVTERVLVEIPPLEQNITIRNTSSPMYMWGNIPSSWYAYAGSGGSAVASANMAPVVGGTITANSYSGTPTILYYMDSTIDVNDYTYSEDITVAGPEMPTDGEIWADAHEPMMWQSPAKEFALYDYRGNKLFNIPGFWSMRKTGETRRITVTPIFDVSGMAIQINFVGNPETATSIIDEAMQGMMTTFQCDTIPFVNDRWLSYKLTSLDTDRSNAILSAVGNVVTGGIYGAYGGALVGSRSASGNRDDDERRNTLLKRGAIGASIVGGLSSIGAGLVTGMIGWQNQKNKEKAVRNEASQIKTGMGVLSYLNDQFDLYITYTTCDQYNRELLRNNYMHYGYECNVFDKPNLKSRKYYNYLITQGCNVGGSVSADIKQQIAQIFDSGVTIFHMDYCSTPDYPTNEGGQEYENIERSLI